MSKNNTNPLTGLVDKVLIFYSLLEKYSLNEYEYCIIDLLRRASHKEERYCQCTMKNIADKMCIFPSHVKYYIDKLLKDHFIEKIHRGFRIIHDELYSDLTEISYKGIYAQVSFQFNDRHDIKLFQSMVLWRIYYVKHYKQYENASIEYLRRDINVQRSSMDFCINKLVEKKLITHEKGTSKIEITSEKVLEELYNLKNQKLISQKTKFGS